MKPLKKNTLLNIEEEFPTFGWQGIELEELVDPKLGIITAFSEILEQIETIMNLDLEEVGLGGGFRSEEV